MIPERLLFQNRFIIIEGKQAIDFVWNGKIVTKSVAEECHLNDRKVA